MTVYTHIFTVLTGIFVLLLTSCVLSLPLSKTLILFSGSLFPSFCFFLCALFFLERNFEKFTIPKKEHISKFPQENSIQAHDLFKFKEEEPVFIKSNIDKDVIRQIIDEKRKEEKKKKEEEEEKRKKEEEERITERKEYAERRKNFKKNMKKE